MLNAELVSGDEIFSVIEPAAWNELVENSFSNTPFQRFTYQKAWWTHLGEGDLLSIVVRDESHTLKGLGLFNLRGDRLVFNASKEETDYLDIIAAEADAESVWAVMFDCLCSDACPTWVCFDCYNLMADSPSREILPRLAESRGFLFSEERAEVCPVIPLGETFDAYLAGLDKKQRGEIKRKLRRAMGGAEAVCHLVSAEDNLAERIDLFLDLLQKSTPEKGAWLNEGRRRLFHDVAADALANGSLVLMFIEIEAEAIAALFNFDYNDRLWVYNSGIDTTRYGNLSLGVVVTSKAIEYAIDHNLSTFDFLRGDEQYKYRFGAKDTEIFRIQVTQAS